MIGMEIIKVVIILMIIISIALAVGTVYYFTIQKPAVGSESEHSKQLLKYQNL
ncbi:MAG: hypothetical protein J7K26_00420 [Candidatus Aenigmarchaeota archaeon]|nr:hypothetical protein [Candidatus Aenigmarchaeota archaeon]